MYTSKPTGEGGSYKIEPLVRGAAKISSFEFQYLHPSPPPPPIVILNELSLRQARAGVLPVIHSYGVLGVPSNMLRYMVLVPFTQLSSKGSESCYFKI